MLVTIDIQDSAFDKVMYLLNHLQDDVKILQKDDFLEIVSDNKYPTISKSQANKRVQKALDDYKNNKDLFLDEVQSSERMNKYINNLKNKYEN